jgi:hypothetical protein
MVWNSFLAEHRKAPLSRCALTVLQRVPLWWYFPAGVLLLWIGLTLLSTFIVGSPDVERLESLRQAPLWVLAVVPLGEALIWTVAFVEAGAYFQASTIGAVLGVAAYSVLLHSQFGLLGIVVSAWIGAVLNASYLVMRRRSRVAATVNAIALRWTFIVYAYHAAVSAGSGSAA